MNVTARAWRLQHTRHGHQRQRSAGHAFGARGKRYATSNNAIAAHAPARQLGDADAAPVVLASHDAAVGFAAVGALWAVQARDLVTLRGGAVAPPVVKRVRVDAARDALKLQR